MSFRFTTRSLFALAGGVAWALAASCGSNDDSCSTHGCHDQFAIEFVKDGWTEGTYDVELDIDGEVVQCQFVLPIPEEGLTFCPPVSDGPLASTSIEFWVIRGDASEAYRPRGVVIVATPREVSIVVSRGEQELVRGSFAVGDERYYPNGAECDDGCLSELEELMFDGAAGGAGGGAGAGGSR